MASGVDAFSFNKQPLVRLPGLESPADLMACLIFGVSTATIKQLGFTSQVFMYFDRRAIQ